MPALPIAQTLITSLPWLSPPARAVIHALAAGRGAIVTADDMAARVGLQSRFQLARLFQREGTPAFRQLADWICVLQWLWEAEEKRVTLLQLSRGTATDAATCYRRCKRILGVPWSVARARGVHAALIQFLERCRCPVTRKPAALARSAFVVSGATTVTRRTWPGPAVVGLGRRMTVSPWRASPATARSRHPRGELALKVSLPNKPTDVAVSSIGVVYATRAYAASVERLDLAARQSAASIPVGCNPTRVVFDRTGQRAYVTNQFSDNISVIDVATSRRIHDIPVIGNPAPVIVAPDARRLYVTTNSDVLYAIDAATRQVLRTLALPAPSHHLTMHPHGTRLYVATRAAGTVLEIDATTCTVLRTFEAGGQTQALAIAADCSELYVANESGGLDVVDLQRGIVIASLQLGGAAYGLALTPDNVQLYVGLVSRERVLVVDRASLRVTNTIGTGGLPREIAFTRSGDCALVANEGGWIDIVT